MERFVKFVSTLFASRTQAHIFHLQTKGPGSLAKHEALNDYYDGIVGLVDGLIESTQGRYGIVRGYSSPSQFKEDDQPLTYFEALCQYVETIRKSVPQDSYIQNEIDEIVKLIESTKYKLQNLQ
jgi:hypothetical protein